MADINLGVGGANSATGGYEIDNSVMLDRFDSQYLQHTYDSAPTNLKKNTLSMWFKRTELDQNQGLYQFGDDASGDHSYIRFTRETFNGSNGFLRGKVNGTGVVFLNTAAQFRDTSGWYHLVVVWDTTQSTASERLNVYINGVKQTDFATDNRSSVIPQNYDTTHGENGKFVLIGEGVYKMSTYIAETHFVDGQALTASDFGEFDADTGIWKPKQYTGTYGNNGFYLDFKNASNLGEDQSGNNHDFTLNNVSSANQSTDTPTNNFATINVLSGDNDEVTTSNANLTLLSTTQTNTMVSTLGVSQGKWYWEAKINGSNTQQIGIIEIGKEGTLQDKVAGDSGSNGYILLASNGSIYNNGSVIDTGSTFTTNDIIGIALDLDNNFIYIYKNGTLTNTGGTSITNSSYFAASSAGGGSDLISASYNFGNPPFSISSGNSDGNGYGNFEYSVPSGYYALNTKNLAEYG